MINTEAIEQILNDNPATRDDDMLLYGAFLARYMLVAPDETFYHVMETAKSRNLPSFESVIECRKMIQYIHSNK